jgi:ATP-binding cassette subfamily F protein uup
MSFNEQREFSKIEDELPKLEIEQLDLSSKLTESLSFEELQKVTDRLSVIAKTIEDYNLRWLELAEKMG